MRRILLNRTINNSGFKTPFEKKKAKVVVFCGKKKFVTIRQLILHS